MFSAPLGLAQEVFSVITPLMFSTVLLLATVTVAVAEQSKKSFTVTV